MEVEAQPDNSGADSVAADIQSAISQASAPETPAPEAAPEAPAAETLPDLRVPSSWDAESKAAFQSVLPRLGKEKEFDRLLRQALKREDDFHKGINEYKGYKDKWSEVDQVLQPYQATLQSLGLKSTDVIRDAMAADHALRYGAPQQKSQAFQRLAEHYGIDLKSLGQPQQNADPTVSALQRELYDLKTRVQSRDSQAEQHTRAQTLAELEAFEKDPAHMYYADVKPEMAALLESGTAKDLKDAYDRAVYANPKVRTLVLEQQKKVEEAKRIEDQKRKAANAQRASFDVTGGGSAQPVKSDDDSIGALLRRHLAATQPT